MADEIWGIYFGNELCARDGTSYGDKSPMSWESALESWLGLDRKYGHTKYNIRPLPEYRDGLWGLETKDGKQECPIMGRPPGDDIPSPRRGTWQDMVKLAEAHPGLVPVPVDQDEKWEIWGSGGSVGTPKRVGVRPSDGYLAWGCDLSGYTTHGPYSVVKELLSKAIGSHTSGTRLWMQPADTAPVVRVSTQQCAVYVRYIPCLTSSWHPIRFIGAYNFRYESKNPSNGTSAELEQKIADLTEGIRAVYEFQIREWPPMTTEESASPAKVVSYQERNTRKEADDMTTENTKPTTTSSKMAEVKSDVVEGMYRAAALQGGKVAVEFVLKFLSTNGLDVRKNRKLVQILKSPAGVGLAMGILGYLVLPHVPGVSQDPRVAAFATELRRGGYAALFDMFGDLARHELIPAVTKLVSALPMPKAEAVTTEGTPVAEKVTV